MNIALATVLSLTVTLSAVTGCAAATDDGSSSEDSELASASPLGATPHGDKTRYPIILVHGFLGSADGFGGFHDLVDDALVADGHVVHRAALPPLGDVHQRALALANEVDHVLATTGATKVDLVAHSMGGLDARELISTLGYGDRVASLTTISTPHQGSAIADVSLGLVKGASDDALAAVARIIGRDRGAIANDANLRGALRDLAEASAPAFNAAHPDDARVYYQSWAGVSSVLGIPNPADKNACDGALLAHAGRADVMSPLLAPGAVFVAHGGDPNDGLVRVASAKWGTFRGCVPADHTDEIGAFHDRALDPHSGFDFVRFYRNVAFDLSARGF